jgi:hypothetical protein
MDYHNLSDNYINTRIYHQEIIEESKNQNGISINIIRKLLHTAPTTGIYKITAQSLRALQKSLHRTNRYREQKKNINFNKEKLEYIADIDMYIIYIILNLSQKILIF